MKCSSCGAEVDNGLKFCCECGARVLAVTQEGATAVGANAEQLAAYKAEALVVLKAGPVTLMSRRRLKTLQKQFSLTDAQAQDVEREILADIERTRAEEQRRAVEEEAGAAAEEKVTYQDVFDRVYDFIDNHGYQANLDEDDGTIDMCVDDDGWCHMCWDSVEDFLTAPWEGHACDTDASGCANIFEIIDYWWEEYDDLADHWAAALAKNCHKLADVDLSDTSPAGLMKALDEVGLEDEEDEDCEEEDEGCEEEDEDCEEEDEDCEEESSPSGRYSVILKVAAENQGPMLRDLVTMTGKRLWPDISDMISNLPAVVATGLDEEEAKKYALALILDGAEAAVVADGASEEESEDEGVDEDPESDAEGHEEEDVEAVDEGVSTEVGRGDEPNGIGPSPTGLYTVIVKDWGNGRTRANDNLRIEFNCKLLTGLGYDKFNALMNSPTPFTLVKKIPRERAEAFLSVLKKEGCAFEIVAVEPLPEGVIDFEGIHDYVEDFKKTTKCDDIVLPETSSFDKKWTNLSAKVENSRDGLSLDRDDAIAILDCTVFGSAKNGVLIDKTGIYTNNDSKDISGMVDWSTFKADGAVTKKGSYEVHLIGDPDVGINVSGCSLSLGDTLKFFKGLLSLVRGEEA